MVAFRYTKAGKSERINSSESSKRGDISATSGEIPVTNVEIAISGTTLCNELIEGPVRRILGYDFDDAFVYSPVYAGSSFV